MDQYDKILEDALAYGRTHAPSGGKYHMSAFANSVAYLCTGMSGGYGGPSVREHTVSYSLEGKLPSGEWEFKSACLHCFPLCFGGLNQQHLNVWKELKELCFDDDPEDVEILNRWMDNH